MANDAIVRFHADSSELENKVKNAVSKMQEMERVVRKTNDTFAVASKEEIAFVRSLGSMETKATTAKGKLAELTNAFTEYSLIYKRMSAEEKKGDIGRGLNQSLIQLQGRIKGLKVEMASVQSKLFKDGFSAQFGQGLSSAFSMFGPAALATGGVMAAVGGLKKVMGDMVSINMQFEQSTANLAAVMGTTKDNVSALTNQAKQLGATTQYTAVQITELQTNLARLGFTEQEILNSTKSVQALATATGADLGEAANLAGAALRGFGLNATEMERVASVLAVSTTKSALSFEKLATAVPIVAPVAKQFGFTIEDVTVLLGKLSDAGFDASSAATASRNIFLNMANSSGKLAQALGRPIRSIEDLAPALKELKDRGIDLAEMLSLTDKRSVAAFATFVEGADTMVDLKNSITGCSDALQGMVDEQLNTLQGSVTILNSAFEGLMLTFSESNGTIKTVVDSLTNLLTAYTNWRKRRQGGDAAISTFELGEDPAKTKEYIESKRAEGMTDAQIKSAAEADKAAIEAERDAAKALYDQLAEIDKLKGKEHDVAQNEWNIAFREQFKNYKVRTDGRSDAYLMRQIASMNDQAATLGAVIGQFTPSSTETATAPTGSGEGSSSSASNSKAIAKLKAQYEEQEKAQIAALDRMAMNEEDYEAEVYRIRRETLEKIAGLYQEDTAEKARANAAISQLDIQYQGIQMRLANKGNKPTKTKAEEYTGFGEFSQKAVDARMSHAKKAMNEAAIGSDRYLYEADKIVDLTTFQNLLKAATEAGMNIDTSYIEETLGQIDMGLGVSDVAWQQLVAQINEQIANLGLDPIELDVKTGGVKSLNKEVEGTIDHVSGAASAFQALGDAMSNIDDPGAQVAGLIAQAIGSVAAGYGAATAQAATMGPWAWITFAITGLATMISTIAGIKSATAGSYANGGIVPGTSYSGDNTIIAANAGEVVLNRAQQTNLASQLEAGSLPNNLHLSTEISGTNLRVVLDNDNRSKGGSRGAYSRIK